MINSFLGKFYGVFWALVQNSKIVPLTRKTCTGIQIQISFLPFIPSFLLSFLPASLWYCQFPSINKSVWKVRNFSSRYKYFLLQCQLGIKQVLRGAIASYSYNNGMTNERTSLSVTASLSLLGARIIVNDSMAKLNTFQTPKITSTTAAAVVNLFCGPQR